MNAAPPEVGINADLVAILAMLAEGISILTPSPDVLDRLRALGGPGTELPDSSVLAGWRQELLAFVEEIRAARELRRQKALAAVSAARMDQATGLPGVTAAQSEIEKAATLEEPPLLAVLAVDQLRMLNARFGRNFGDEVMAIVASELSRQMADIGVLFRWNGPAFLLISSLPAAQGRQLDSRLTSLANSRIDSTVQVENRSIHVKVTFSWHVRPLGRSEGVIEVSRALDDLLAIKGKAD